MRITLPFVSFTLLVSLALIVEAWPVWPQRKGGAGLRVIVQPEAKITIETVDPPDSDGLGHMTRWFRVDLAVRVNSGATAALFLEHIAMSTRQQEGKETLGLTYFVKYPGAESPRAIEGSLSSPLFTTQKNGTYSLLIGVKSSDESRDKKFSLGVLRLVLRSSDGLLNVSKII